MVAVVLVSEYLRRRINSQALSIMSSALLPPEIIRLVSACLVKDEGPSNRTLQLVSFCGVCQRWREFGRETRGCLEFDASDSQHGPKSTLARFRRAPIAQKRGLFNGASRLLTGYSELMLSGEAISEQMLLNIAVANGPALTSLKVHGAPHVTDAGLCTLISAAPNLRCFSIEDAGPGVIGHFVPTLLQHCKQLETLLIEGAASMDWAVLRLSGAWAVAAAARAASPPPAQQAELQPRSGSFPTSSSSMQAGNLPAGMSQSYMPQQQRPASAPTAARADAPAQHAQDSLSPQPSADAAGSPAAFDMQRSSTSTATRPGARSTGNTYAGSSSSFGLSQQQQQQQAGSSHGPSSSQQGLPPVPRLSSGSSCSGSSEFSSCQDEGAVSDDSSSDGSSAGSSVDAGSDSTSISMPAQAVDALAQQLRHILSGSEEQPPSSNPAAAAGSSSGAPHADSNQQQQRRSRRSAVKPVHAALRKLRVRLANVDTLQQLLLCVPGLTDLQLDDPALSIQAASVVCPGLRRLSYLVSSPAELDSALMCLGSMRNLRALELEVKGMVLSTEQLRVIGLLPLRELCLDSHAYRQHPSMPRPQYSHLDNEGVKGLVDSICSRMRTELMPLKLSLCGATALKQEAVSALLRLPILASIDTGGCVKLTPMDRMRLVAKVKAGQGLMDKSAAAGGTTGGSAGGLRLPHVLL